MKRTIETNKKLYALFNELGIDEDTKYTLVMAFTGDRTEHSSEMSEKEAQTLISKLADMKPATKRQNEFEQQLRRNIFKLMYDIGLLNSNMTNAEKLEYINTWIMNKLHLDKQLNALTIDELMKFIKQLQAVRRNYQSKTSKQAMYN